MGLGSSCPKLWFCGNRPHVHEFTFPLWSIICPLEALVTELFLNDFLGYIWHWLKTHYMYFNTLMLKWQNPLVNTMVKSIINKSSNNIYISKLPIVRSFLKLYIHMYFRKSSLHSRLFYLSSFIFPLFLSYSNIMNFFLFPYVYSYLALRFWL